MENKPSWENAPEWANFVAMDLHGNWNWFEEKPFISGAIWDAYKGKFELAQKSKQEWKQTLQERPK